MDPLILLGIMGAFVVLMMFTSSRARKKQMEQREMMMSQLEPGIWVKTIGRMYGRIVDIDDRVVILETLDGTELIFGRDAIAAIEEPEFAAEDEAETTEVKEATVLSDDPEGTDVDSEKPEQI